MEKTKQIKWTSDLVNKLRDVWTSGTTKEIEIAFSGVSNSILRDTARRFKIKRGYEFKCKQKLNKLLNETNFNYYWLGFIMADGYFSPNGELKITLSITDINHLNKFAEYIGVNVHIRDEQTYKKYTSNKSCVLTVMDVNSMKILRERFLIDGNKTYNPCSLKCLDTDEKYLAFFCGFVDGDGCITQAKTGNANMLRIQCHSSWYENLKLIGERLKIKYGFDFKCYIDKQGYAKFAMYRYDELVIIKNEINKLNIPYLERKWNKIK